MTPDGTTVVVRDGEFALPSGIVGVGIGEAFSDGVRSFEGVERRREIALREEDVADLPKREQRGRAAMLHLRGRP